MYMARPVFSTACAMGAIAFLVALPERAAAQLTIQQPVFGVNSVATTVSVPDGGSALLGGVSRAGESRTTSGFGPLRSGTSTGLFREGSSMRVHATIHDFDEMDRRLLNEASGGPAGATAARSDDPYQQLLARTRRRGESLAASANDIPFRGRIGGVNATAATTAHSPAEVRPAAPAPKFGDDGGENFFQLGQSAEERGKPAVAKIHYRMAAKRGHARAGQRLAALDGTREDASGVAVAPR